MLTYIAIVEGANMKIIWFLRFKLFAIDGRLSRRDVARTELPPDHDRIETVRNNEYNLEFKLVQNMNSYTKWLKYTMLRIMLKLMLRNTNVN